MSRSMVRKPVLCITTRAYQCYYEHCKEVIQRDAIAVRLGGNVYHPACVSRKLRLEAKLRTEAARRLERDVEELRERLLAPGWEAAEQFAEGGRT